MRCLLGEELAKLKRSSAESVDHAEYSTAEDAYLHVKRKIEDELKSLLIKVKTRGDKCLVLLCGSAGDGKSHLLAHLGHEDPDHPLDQFTIYNDATESEEPDKTSIETIAQRLRDFDDAHCEINDHHMTILAINLGTLNNFISSSYGEEYSRLREYVSNNQIISGFLPDNTYEESSIFQYVSFSDYHLFTLTEDGPRFDYIDALIEKICKGVPENNFYDKYKKCVECENYMLCPIRNNYEFLTDKRCRQYVEYCLLQAEFKDKMILSTRDVLDFIYHCLVPPRQDKMTEGLNSAIDSNVLTAYLKSTLPMLLYDSEGVSPVLTLVGKYDPLKVRNSALDMAAIHVHTLDSVEEEYKQATADTPYQGFTEIKSMDQAGFQPELKQTVFAFMERLEAIKRGFVDKTSGEFNQFLKYLYFQNANKPRKYAEVYRLTRDAVLRWNGSYGDQQICIDDQNERYSVVEQLRLEEYQHSGRPNMTGERIVRYIPFLQIWMKKEDGDERTAHEIDIDYPLYRMLLSVKRGYMPTAYDKNLHTDFNSFVKQMSMLGDKAKRLIIQDKSTGKRMMFEASYGSYGFKVDE